MDGFECVGADGARRPLVPSRGGDVHLIDLWNTRCQRCPTALRHAADLRQRFPSVRYVACALATAPAAHHEEDVALWQEYVATHRAALFAHFDTADAFVPFDDKEALKRALDFATLPFCVLLDAQGAVRFAASPLDDAGGVSPALERALTAATHPAAPRTP